MSKIICATDFSPPADRALDFAAALAQRLGDELELVHVVDSPAVVSSDFPLADEVVMNGLADAAEKRLFGLAAALRGRGVTVTTRSFEGSVVDVLLRYASEQSPRLLAFGTHGRKGLARFLVGSTAERIARRATVPVLVVPGHYAGAPATLAGGDRVLGVVAGVEVSSSSDAALTWCKSLTDTTLCDLSLVHVYWPLREHARFGLGSLETAFEGDDQIAALLERELRPRINEVLGGKVAPLHLRPSLGAEPDLLVRQADAAGADLLVVGSNQLEDGGKGGSTAVAVLRAAHCPVVCVPATRQNLPRAKEPARPLRKLLVPVDLSQDAKGAVAVACQMLKASGGVVELCHVMEPSDGNESDLARPELERRLCELVPERDDHSILVHTSLIEGPSAANAILQAAERLDIDAIVLASDRPVGLRGALGGSVADDVIRSARKPVMLVPMAEHG